MGRFKASSVIGKCGLCKAAGLTNHEVLRAATLHGAEAIGYAQDLGSLEAGKLADLLVLE